MSGIKGGATIQRNMFEDEETQYDQPDEDLQTEGPGTQVDLTPADKGDKIEIEVVDDTPEEDQGRPATPPEDYDDDDPDLDGDDNDDDDGVPSEEELRGVSERTVKRIKKLTFERETERRAREAVERERDNLVNLSQQLIRDNQRLESSLTDSTTSLYDSMKRGNESALEAATEEYQTAFEAGDSKAMAAAQRKMARLEAEGVNIDERIASAKVKKPAEGDGTAAAPAAQPNGYQPTGRAPIHPKTTSWLQRNQWFQAPGREEMTNFALGVHEGLLAQGVDPTSDDYYRKLDSRLAEVYPEFFKGSKNLSGKAESSQGKKPAATSRATVAPASRAGSGIPRKVRLTASQVSIAKRLGLTPEQYARQLIKDQAHG